MNKNYIIKKSNYFIMNCSYDLSLGEQKIILTLASMVQPTDEDFKPYQFRIADFMELLDIKDKSKYTEIPKTTKELMKKVFEIEENDKIIQTAWLSSAVYKKGDGMVELEFSPKLKPYMLKLNNMFTQYKLANILSMKSKYSPRIYEILKANQFKAQGYVEIDVDELRKLLKVENVYPLYADFKRNVIIKSQKELKKLSDISFEIEEKKTGRKVTALKFNINNNLSDSYDRAEILELMDMLKELKVDKKTAERIYKLSEQNLEKIRDVYNKSKNKNIDNIIGWITEMVKPGRLNESVNKEHTSNFNNFKPREYDYETLEKKLLGWDED